MIARERTTPTAAVNPWTNRAAARTSTDCAVAHASDAAVKRMTPIEERPTPSHDVAERADSLTDREPDEVGGDGEHHGRRCDAEVATDGRHRREEHVHRHRPDRGEPTESEEELDPVSRRPPHDSRRPKETGRPVEHRSIVALPAVRSSCPCQPQRGAVTVALDPTGRSGRRVAIVGSRTCGPPRARGGPGSRG